MKCRWDRSILILALLQYVLKGPHRQCHRLQGWNAPKLHELIWYLDIYIVANVSKQKKVHCDLYDFVYSFNLFSPMSFPLQLSSSFHRRFRDFGFCTSHLDTVALASRRVRHLGAFHFYRGRLELDINASFNILKMCVQENVSLRNEK
jgi:hypothetical protein